MKWSEVRTMYPDKFVKFEVIDYHTIDNRRYVDEISLIRVINDSNEALKEFSQCKEGQFVYSTNNVEVIIEEVRYSGIRY